MLHFALCVLFIFSTLVSTSTQMLTEAEQKGKQAALPARPLPALPNAQDFLVEQEKLREAGRISRSAAETKPAIQDDHDDHVFSSAPTESTYAPTPSGTTNMASTCMGQCTEFNSSSWNLDHWCKFYWDAECFLPDQNYLNINPAGKKEVADYACVPSCLSSTSCGASYCKIFSHLSSSCRTGYAHLLFNSTLQDHTHERCVDAFLRVLYAERRWPFNNGANLTHYVWRASFTIVPVKYSAFVADARNLLAVRSATAHVLGGVSLSDVSVVAVEDLSIAAPTLQPTHITPWPTQLPTPQPSRVPTEVPTARPTRNQTTICDTPKQKQWCNSNQGENIYLGLAVDAPSCQALCNAYIGAEDGDACCQWYSGNSEVLYRYGECSLQPNAKDTEWPDGDTYWSAPCNIHSAQPTQEPTQEPTQAPALAPLAPVPTPAPSLATPLPTQAPSLSPTPAPTVAPTEFFSAYPTRAPTVAAVGIRVTVQVNSSVETLGLPIRSRQAAYEQLRGELEVSFTNRGFLDSLTLAGTSYNASTVKGVVGVHDLTSSLPGVDAAAFPTAAPTVDNRTPAPTPTTFFEAQNSTAVDSTDNTAAIAGGAAAAVVGVGVAGTAAYQYAGSNLVKVVAEPPEGTLALLV